MRSKDDFDLAIRNHEKEHEEGIEAIKTFIDELTQAKHYSVSDISKRKEEVSKKWDEFKTNHTDEQSHGIKFPSLQKFSKHVDQIVSCKLGKLQLIQNESNQDIADKDQTF